MTEKYIDLASRISNESGAYHLRDTIIEGVLEWLDDNSDQVPGRTITAGEVGRWSHLINGRYIETPTIIDFLEALGITVIPDPEPTNAEKLEKIVWDSDGPIGSISLDRASRLAAWLDEHGVKAPGDDDD